MINGRGLVVVGGIVVSLAGCTSEVGGSASPADLADEAGPAASTGIYTRTVLDSDAVEDAIRAQFEGQNGLALSGIDCREDMVVAVGATYTCTGTVQGEGPTSFTIAITDDDGGYTWSESAG